MGFDAKQIKALLERPFVSTVVHTISRDEIHAEEHRIAAALRAGGYADADLIEMEGPAMDVLVGKLMNFLLENGMDGFCFNHKVEPGVGVVVTVDFKDHKDAVFFKLSL